MTLSFYLFDIILSTAFIILLPFVDVERRCPKFPPNCSAEREKLSSPKVKSGSNRKSWTDWRQNATSANTKKTE